MQSTHSISEEGHASVDHALNKECPAGFLVNITLKVMEVALIVLTAAATGYFGWSSFQLSAELHSTTVWLFEAKTFVIALGTAIASLALTINMIYKKNL